MKETIITKQIKQEYIQWLKDIGKMKYELTDIYVNNNGEIKTEKNMAWVARTSFQDWKEFCKIKGIEYEGEINILAIY